MPINCPAPDCETTWPDNTPPQALVALIELHGRTAHPANPMQVQPAPSGVRVEKVKRPTIAAAGTSEEWAYFSLRWSEYKAATHLNGADIVYQLLECCQEDLRKDLTRTYGALTSLPEQTVLANIKTLAVRQENIMVARVQLQNMCQDRDEPVRAFAARLRGQAGVCNYKVDCSCSLAVDFSDVIVRDSLIRGLEDEDIRMDILGQSNQNMTLEEVLQHVEAKESGKRSASRLVEGNNTMSAAAATSTYKRKERLKAQNAQTRSQGCDYCGQTDHDRSRQERVKHCPAYNHKCKTCGLRHHYETVCRKSLRKSRATPWKAPDKPDDATAVFEALCSVTATPSTDADAITLEHHVYDQFCNAWERRGSDPQPFIDVSIQAMPQDTKDLGLPKPSHNATLSARYPAMADTGCQSCLAGTKLLSKLGLTKRDLIPVKMKMTAANERKIDICGALALRISGTSPSGQTHETRQIVYFTDSSDRLFLSKQACMALGMITSNFPTIGEAFALHSPTSSTPDQSQMPMCDCPRRQMPPTRPTSLPFPATEENRERLEQWLLDTYKSSTFNTCEHQPLPMMAGPPLRLMVDPEAQPVAHHTPIPVPIHWQR